MCVYHRGLRNYTPEDIPLALLNKMKNKIKYNKS